MTGRVLGTHGNDGEEEKENAEKGPGLFRLDPVDFHRRHNYEIQHPQDCRQASQVGNDADESRHRRDGRSVGETAVGRLVGFIRPHDPPQDEEHARADKTEKEEDRRSDDEGKEKIKKRDSPEEKGEQAADQGDDDGHDAGKDHRIEKPARPAHPPVKIRGVPNDRNHGP